MACACGLAMLNSCAGANPFITAPVDKTSSAADLVTAKARSQRAYPAFADIPPVPVDVRPVRAWGVAARDTAAAGQRLEQATAPSTWSLTGTESFAGRAQTSAQDETPEASTAAATEAFARQIRQRATPPPPPNR